MNKINYITDIFGLVSGLKTYIIGAAMIGIGFYTKDTQLILEGLSVITLRAGIAKLNQQATTNIDL